MTVRLIDFSPAAWQAYQAVKATENGPVIRQALEQIASSSALVQTGLAPVRYKVVEERLARTPEVWGLPVDGQDGSRWLIMWREMPYVVEIGHIGAAPFADRRPRQQVLHSAAGNPAHAASAGQLGKGDALGAKVGRNLQPAADCLDVAG